MRAIWVVLMLGLWAAVPAVGQTAPEATVEQPQATAPKPAGLFAILAPNPESSAERQAKRQAAKAARMQARAERQAQRAAAKAARQQARAEKAALRSGDAPTSGGQAGSAKDIETAVQYAIDNKPKGRWWCVPFARMVSGVELRGNAKTWWAQAKGRYARGSDPQVGAVMAFAASGAMPRGHVAVVSEVVSDRELRVVQANWERAMVTLHDLVVDVSEKGDWSRVRVENSAGSLGRVNPVNGFIYSN
jgi:surface antigen